MVALVAVTPLIWLRSRRRWQFTAAFILIAICLPYLAGNEIRQRFFTIEQYETDASANARFDSWNAALKIANDYPIFGVGIRNSPLMSYGYGADMEGRVIHSQYLQTLADAGYPGLTLYLVAIAATWLTMARARRLIKNRPDKNSALARSMLNGVEGALFVFCFGAMFLSLEVFELPYFVALMGVQIATLVRGSVGDVPTRVPVPVMGRGAVLSPLRPRPS
jgi:O-antigen ligase